VVDRDEAAGQKLVEETGSNGKLALIDENAGDVCLRVRWPATPWRRVQSRGAMGGAGATEFFNGLRLFRLEVSNSRPIVERVRRKEAAATAKAEADKIAADLADKERIASEKAALELSQLEAQVAEIDRQHAIERSLPGGSWVDIGREGTGLRAAYESRLKFEGDVKHRLEVLREEMRQKNAYRSGADVKPVRKMSE
jgi:hypothetical protein